MIMDLSKEYNKISKNITSSSSKRKILFERLEAFTDNLKKNWYKKLLNKLNSINDNEMSLEQYISEIEEKIN